MKTTELLALTFVGEDAEGLSAKSVLLGDAYTDEGHQVNVEADSPTELAQVLNFILNALGLKTCPAKLKNYATSRATHLVRLTRASGSGGFLRPAQTSAKLEGPVVTEDDYPREESMTGNAADQKLALLVISQVVYQGEKLALVDAIAKVGIDAFVPAMQTVSDWTEGDLRELTETLLAAQPQNQLSQEPQVFVADGEGNHILLSVVPPLGLPFGLTRAKNRLKALYEVEMKPIKEGLEAEKKSLEATAKQIEKKLKKTGKSYIGGEEREQLLEELKKVTADIDLNKENNKAPKFLSFESFVLPIGGAQPQNSGARLNKRIHYSALFNDVPKTRVAHHLSSNTFGFGYSLIKAPNLYKEKLPKFWGGPKAEHKKAQQAFLRELVIASLEGLCDLRDTWQIHQEEPQARLTPEAEANVQKSTEAWALFIKGADKTEERVASRKEIARRVQACVKEALKKTFKDKITDDIDSVLAAVAEEVVHLEHA